MNQNDQHVPLRFTFLELILVTLIHWSKKPSSIIILVVAAVIGVVGAIQGFGDRSNIPLLHLIIIFSIIVLILCLVCVFLLFLYIFLTVLIQWKDYQNSEEWLEVNNDGILLSNGLISALVPKKNIKGIFIGNRFIIVLTRGRNNIVIPKRVFETFEIETRFLNHVKSFLEKPAN